MRTNLIMCFVILSTLAVARINLKDVGTRQLTKVSETSVLAEWILYTADGNEVQTDRHFFTLSAAQWGLAKAQGEFAIYDVNAVEAVRLVFKRKVLAAVEVARWQAVVDKFAGAIDE